MKTIIVGIDSSEAAKTALRWALDNAADDDTVVVVHAWQYYAAAGFEVPAVNIPEFETEAHRLVKELVAELAEDGSGPTIETEVHYGHPGRVLIERAEDADLLVVGTRGHGGFRGLLLGSVSTYAVHHAPCPLVVVPSGDSDDDD